MVGVFAGHMEDNMDGDARRLSRRELGVLLLGAFATSLSGKAVAATPAEDYVKRIAGEVMTLANSGGKGPALRGRFASLLNRYVSLQSIANFALGPYQKKISASERQQLYSLFSNYAAALFVYYVNDFKGSNLEITGARKDGKFTLINSSIVGGGREQVRWRLTGSGGSYRVSDINIKGVWLTLATKKRFSEVLKRSNGDFSKLFAELKEADTW
jgi:phospholipid transport system substrate-binding protein